MNAPRRVAVLAVFAMLASARGDVLVFNNGTLLAGRVQRIAADSMEMHHGADGTSVIRKSDVRFAIFCPRQDEPDSYFKAGARAERAGMLTEAMACYEQSVASEPANAAEAATYIAALRPRIMNAAAQERTAAQLTGADRMRFEAAKAHEEGRRLLAAAHLADMAATDTTRPGGDTIRAWGRSFKANGQLAIARGNAILTEIDRQLAAAAAAKAQAEAQKQEPTWQERAKSWLWILGGVVLAVGLGRLLLSPFLRR